MFLDNIKNKMKSDKGAIGSVETVLLIALAVFAVMIVTNYIMGPVQDSADGIGSSIEDMNPQDTEESK